MDIKSIGGKTFSECGHCQALLQVDGTDVGQSRDDIREELRKHRKVSPACDKWYNDLPTMADLQASWAAIPKPLGPPALYPTYEEWMSTAKAMLNQETWSDEELFDIASAMWDAKGEGDLSAADQRIVFSWRAAQVEALT